MSFKTFAHSEFKPSFTEESYQQQFMNMSDLLRDKLIWKAPLELSTEEMVRYRALSVKMFNQMYIHYVNIDESKDGFWPTNPSELIENDYRDIKKYVQRIESEEAAWETIWDGMATDGMATIYGYTMDDVDTVIRFMACYLELANSEMAFANYKKTTWPDENYPEKKLKHVPRMLYNMWLSLKAFDNFTRKRLSLNKVTIFDYKVRINKFIYSKLKDILGKTPSEFDITQGQIVMDIKKEECCIQ